MNSSRFISTPEREFILLSSVPARVPKHLLGKPETKNRRSPRKGSFLLHSYAHSTRISPPVLQQALHATEGGEDRATPGSPAVATRRSRRLSQEPPWLPRHTACLHAPQHSPLVSRSPDAGNAAHRPACRRYYYNYMNLLPISAHNQMSPKTNRVT